MSSKRNQSLKLRDLYSESLIRDLILSFFLFLMVIAQNWDNILLLLFPLISFGFGVFFKVIANIKENSGITHEYIIYNPIGYEKKHANRLIFCTLLQLILLFWIGAESFYHPHLIDNYYIYFISIFIFLYSFGFYWLFLDLWKYSRIEILTRGFKYHEIPKLTRDLNNVISIMKMKSLKIISIINFLAFIILNTLNLTMALLTYNNILPGMKINLPGNRSAGSEPISLSIFVYAALIVPPLVAIIFFLICFKDIKKIDNKKLKTLISSLSIDVQEKIIENLQNLDKKLIKKLSLE